MPEDAFDLGGAAAEGVSGADGVKISYVSQNCEDVCGTPSQYAKKWGIEDAVFKSMLAKLGFFSADWSRDMSLLSTGQRKKPPLRAVCSLLRIFMSGTNLSTTSTSTRAR